MIIGLVARVGSGKIHDHGIPKAIEAILLVRSKIRLKVAILKPISAAIPIGNFGLFGAEGPCIIVGGAFGSLFAQCFHPQCGGAETLLVAGAAAGMFAIFAAVLLAVELRVCEWNRTGGGTLPAKKSYEEEKCPSPRVIFKLIQIP